MISSRCSWISVYLFWRTAHDFEPLPSFVAYLALRCVYNPVNCPSVICLPRIAVLSSFGRDTSLVNFTGPRSIFSSPFTRLFTFLAFTFSCYHYHYPLCFLSFVNNKTRQIDNLSKLRWEQSYLCCVQVHVSCAAETYLSLPESYGRQS